jgi:trehalose/maltose hydrolase-like predicted phosphorylase
MTPWHGKAELDRRFDAFVLDWDAIAVPDWQAETSALRVAVERLCALAADVAVISSTDVASVDSQLAARPAGPGRLLLCLNGGSEVFRVDTEGPQLATRLEATGAEESTLDKADSARWVFAELWRRGIGPGLVLIAGEDDSLVFVPEATRATVVSVGPVIAVLEDQIWRRERGNVPSVDVDPEWSRTVTAVDPEHERAHEALLALADGHIGVNGAPLWAHPAAQPRVLAGGVYTGSGPETTLVEAPVWHQFEGRVLPRGRLERTLDLHTGVLRQVLASGVGGAEAVLFSSLARPGTVALRLTAPEALAPAEATRPTPVSVEGSSGGVAVAGVTRRRDDGVVGVERVAAYVTDGTRIPRPEEAVAALAAAEEAGFETLLAEHRAAWARRWETADVMVDGDAELTRAVRSALFCLMASVRAEGEAAVGARGLSGPGYRGHVFWDADVFVLPFLAATHPPAARAMLEYRLRRLPAARAAAQELERAGARFPWESAATGEDVTPRLARPPQGGVVPIRTGELEEHITADVAWATVCYLDWTGDTSFEPSARELLLETARYWASRIRLDREGRAHIYGVIGPDEYHEPVDDNAFTNVMARWNLRRAAALTARPEREWWLRLAEALVDGYDPATGVYEQFAGFFGLEPLIIAEVAPRRPIVADLLLGAERVEGAQVLKQADVLALHHLVPNEVEPGSLGPNLDFYEPRTAHGSSLSPAIHAALFPRAGRPDHGLMPLQLAARLDLDDLTATTAGGVHLATMGGVWQALVMGFGGVRPDGEVLAVDPRLPGAWNGLELRVRFRGVPLRLRAEHELVMVDADAPVAIRVGDAPVVSGRRLRWTRANDSWKVSS